ncbi:RES family NAD+ phosphorylase [Halomonas sp. AOP13-D3-9]
MKLYRIAPERYMNNLSGLGASYRDGARWNAPGNPVVYFGTSASVAMLELGNYLPSPRLLPANYRLGIFELPDDTGRETWAQHQLPDDWHHYPYPESTQTLGTVWLQRCDTLMLLVPSCAVPGAMENIAVINPLHPAITDIHLIDTRQDIYNQRLFRGI